jgi:hypothetical protein
MVSNADTYWHLRTGGDILRTGAVPQTESWSFTATGQPWRNHEWGWEPLTYGCYRLGGMPLLTIFGAAFVVAAMACLFRLVRGATGTRFMLLLGALAMSLPAWCVRPHLFTLFAVPFMLTLLARDRTWALPPLFLVWANLHGGVALAGVLLGAATVVALLRWWLVGAVADRRRAIALAIALPVSGAACLATPMGTGVFHFLGDSMTRIHAVGIGEWQRTTPTDLYGALFWLIAVAFVVLLVARRRALRDGPAASWADWVTVACALVMLPLAIGALRNVPLFVWLAAAAASRLVGPTVRRAPERASELPHATDKPMLNLALLAGGAIMAVAAVGWCYAQRLPLLGWQPIDPRALAAVRACEGPLYNQYDEGGYLVWFVPERPVFIDNRQDPYPVAHMRAQLDVQWGAAPYRPLFERWAIRCAFLPLTSRTVADLNRDGWVTRFRDATYTVLSAPPAAR